MTAPLPLTLSEAQFQKTVINTAMVYGWRVHHAPASMVRGRHMTAIVGHPGLPDLVLARDGVVLLAELKRHGGRPTPGQVAWLAALGGHGRLWSRRCGRRSSLSFVTDRRAKGVPRDRSCSGLGLPPTAGESEMSASGVELIAAERQRQISVEGWTLEHDLRHSNEELIDASIAYLRAPSGWPWAAEFWKPTPGDRMRELVKAGALIAAQIDVMQANLAAMPPAVSLGGGE